VANRPRVHLHLLAIVAEKNSYVGISKLIKDELRLALGGIGLSRSISTSRLGWPAYKLREASTEVSHKLGGIP